MSTERGSSAAVELVRPLGVGEEAIHILERRASAGHLVRIIECDGELDPDILQQAFGYVVANAPLLRTRIVDSADGSVSFALADAEPAFSASRRAAGPDGWTVPFERELNASVGIGDQPLVRVEALCADGGGGDILLTCHHAVADGRSLTELCRELVQAYERIRSGKVAPHQETPGAVRISPPADALLPTLLTGDRLAEVLDEFAIREMGGSDSSATLASDRGTTLGPNRSRMIPLKLPAATAGRLRDIASDNGTTLHGALGSATLIAAAEVLGPGDERALPLNSTVDLRRYLRDFVPPALMGYYVGAAFTRHERSMTTSFWDLARDVRHQLSLAIDRSEHFCPLMLQKAFVEAFVGNQQAPGLATLSNLGHMELPTKQASLGVRSIHGAVPMHAFGPTIYCHVVGVADALMLNVVYPDPDVSSRTANAFAAALQDRLQYESERDE